MQSGPAVVLTERIGEHLGAETRSAHAEQHDIRRSRALYIARERVERGDLRQFARGNIEPAEPAVLVRTGPQGFVLGPEAANIAGFRPQAQFVFKLLAGIAKREIV